MRKRVLWGIVVASFILSAYAFGYNDDWPVLHEGDKELIRFHVIANSDSLEDQALKRAVRDRLIRVLGPEFEKAQSIEDARKIIRENEQLIVEETKEEIENCGKYYEVKLAYGDHPFPTKSYGDYVLPAGNYEALRVIIGEGQGQNWWCVLFPPLCFVDITTSLAKDRATPVMAKTQTQKAEKKVKVKLKIFEIFRFEKSDTNKV